MKKFRPPGGFLLPKAGKEWLGLVRKQSDLLLYSSAILSIILPPVAVWIFVSARMWSQAAIGGVAFLAGVLVLSRHWMALLTRRFFQ